MEQQPRTALWTKNFFIVSSVNFFITLIFYLLLVTIAVYAVEEYHASTSQAGLITGIFIIGTLIGRLFIGRLIDVVGRKKMLFIGLIFFTLTSLLYLVHMGITFLLINRFVHGLAFGVASTATGTIVAQIIPAARKGEGIGYYSMSATLATAFGPFVGLYMSQHTNFQTIFAFCVAMGVFSLITALFLTVPELEAPPAKTAGGQFQLSSFLEPKAIPIAVITLIVGLCYSSVVSFINFYTMELDLVSTASFFFIVYAVAVMVSRPFTGRLMDTKGANHIMYPAFVIMTGGMLLLSQAHSSVVLLLSGALIGLGFGNMQSTTQAIAVKLTPSHRMGFATSTFFIFLDAGFGFGPYLLGYVIPLTGYSTMYAMLGIIVLATSALYYFLYGRTEKEAEAAADVSASV